MRARRAVLLLVVPLAAALKCGEFRGVDAAPLDATPPDALTSLLDGGGASAEGSASDASAVAAYGQVVLTDNPIVFFHLEEASGPAALSAAAPPTPSALIVNPTNAGEPELGVPGRVGRAYLFPGNADTAFLQIADADLVGAGLSTNALQFTGTQPFSLEAWIYITAIDTTYRHLFIKDTPNETPRNEYGIWVRFENGADNHLGFERFSNNVSKSAITTIALNAWHHVVGVYNGSSDTLWLDGRNVATMADTGQTGSKDGDLLIGARQAGCCEFPGTIDEVAIYDHALTDDRIAAHYYAGL